MIRRRLKISLFLLLGILVSLSLFFLKVKDEMVDFEVNYTAGQRLNRGETLYRIEDEHYQFKYSPFSAILYLPLSILPLPAAKGIWFFLIIASVAVLVYLSRRLLQIRDKPWLTLLALLILARYFLRELQLGQINALIAMLLIFMVWLMIQEDDSSRALKATSWTGLLWGLAVALKPYALIFFPYFILKRKWDLLIWGWTFLILSLFIPSIFYGLKGNIRVLQEWVTSLSRSTPHLLDSQDNISLLGCLMKWTGNRTVSISVFIAVVLGLAALLLSLVLKGRGRREAPVLDGALLFILIPLLSPLGWDYTLLISFLGVMIVLHHLDDFSPFLRGLLILNLAVIALSLYDLLGKEAYARFMSWSVITVNFFLLLAYLTVLRFKSIR